MHGHGPKGGGVQSFFIPPGGQRPPRIRRAFGIWLEDSAGNRYIDASSGPVACNLGHGNARVIEAMLRQASEVSFAYPAQFESTANWTLGERLTALAGAGFDHAFPVSGGSEAVESAIKLCRQHAVVRGEPGRWKVISREPGYHGNTLGALTLSGDPVAHAMFGPLLRPMPKIPAPVTYRLPPSQTAEANAQAAAAALEETIEAEGADTVLAFIMEPVGGLATGALVAPDIYYQLVREICARHRVTLIYDEVMSGAGRTGRFLAAEHWPAGRPDLVVLAKGITAGYTPMGAVLAPADMVEDIARCGGFMNGFTYHANPLSCAVAVAVLDELVERDLIGGFMNGFTYHANPLSCAVAVAVLDELVERDLIANAERIGQRLRGGLDAIAAGSAIVGDVRGKGLLLAIELVADKATRRMIPLERRAPYRFQRLALSHGLAVYCRRTSGGKFGDWLMIAPPLIITADEVDELLHRLAGALAEFEAELGGQGVLN
jgi:adenosylmethionine-8-amino-7-oxononanoate aminotransferase